ncbi:MAG TPA: FTR1 family protein [Thermomicrobiaceae bacterium]|nr:FTR1 family protein [Thermomicrobiaceae bacterium]
MRLITALPRLSYRALLLGLAALAVVSVLIWQGVTAAGAPDPAQANLSRHAVIVDSGILVFREGLEAILVLAAVTAGLTRGPGRYWRPIAAGAGVALLASLATWFIVVALISAIDAPALDVQAATGLLAIAVLLVIMNWFFHRIYWTGWIANHNKRRRELLRSAATDRRAATLLGLALLGFSAVYREGFEIVLFLQSLRLRSDSQTVLGGVLIGLSLTAVVAVLTFAAHRHLPYKRMLVLTGVLLGVVLVVMVGESVQELQQAGWIATSTVGLPLPAWAGVWFAAFPTVEGLSAQALAACLVLGSYVAARWRVLSLRQPLPASAEG